MKLRNKKTGGLANCGTITVRTDAGWQDYDTLADLVGEWEDYTPKEPLIKDEKIRKAVRAWAVPNGTYPIYFVDDYTLSYNRGPRIEFENRVFANLDGRPYTIDELCGEDGE